MRRLGIFRQNLVFSSCERSKASSPFIRGALISPRRCACRDEEFLALPFSHHSPQNLGGFFHVHGFKHHANAINFAVNVVIAFFDTDILDFRADFQNDVRALHFQLFHQNHAIAIDEHIAKSVFDCHRAGLDCRCRIRIGNRPLKTAIRANAVSLVGVGVFRAAWRAIWGHNRRALVQQR